MEVSVRREARKAYKLRRKIKAEYRPGHYRGLLDTTRFGDSFHEYSNVTVPAPPAKDVTTVELGAEQGAVRFGGRVVVFDVRRMDLNAGINSLAEISVTGYPRFGE